MEEKYYVIVNGYRCYFIEDTEPAAKAHDGDTVKEEDYTPVETNDKTKVNEISLNVINVNGNVEAKSAGIYT